MISPDEGWWDISNFEFYHLTAEEDGGERVMGEIGIGDQFNDFPRPLGPFDCVAQVAKLMVVHAGDATDDDGRAFKGTQEFDGAGVIYFSTRKVAF